MRFSPVAEIGLRPQGDELNQASGASRTCATRRRSSRRRHRGDRQRRRVYQPQELSGACCIQVSLRQRPAPHRDVTLRGPDGMTREDARAGLGAGGRGLPGHQPHHPGAQRVDRVQHQGGDRGRRWASVTIRIEPSTASAGNGDFLRGPRGRTYSGTATRHRHSRRQRPGLRERAEQDADRDEGLIEPGAIMPRTLLDKIWDDHVVIQQPGSPAVLYVDLHLVHEVTSPQAFQTAARARPASPPARSDRGHARSQHSHARSRHPDRGCTGRTAGDGDELPRVRHPTLHARYGQAGHRHVIGPEQGWTQPGMTIVCGDSHTATHGAFGALAFGIGTSEVGHVLAPSACCRTSRGATRCASTAACSRGLREGHHPRTDQPHRHRRRHGPRLRVRRRGHPGALHGRAHDGVQHEHRGGARRPGRPIDDVTFEYLAGRPRAAGRGLGSGGGTLARPAVR